MKTTIVGLALALASAALASVPARASAPAAAVRAVLEAQQQAWNRGDLVAFMQGYRQSPETEFVGAQGIQHGWWAVLARFRRAYPSRAAMGTLRFDHLRVEVLAPKVALAEGEYHLRRAGGPSDGVFTLLLRRFAAGWRIVLDHTTAFAPKPS